MNNEELYKNTLKVISDMSIDITNLENAIRDIKMIKALISTSLAAGEDNE